MVREKPIYECDHDEFPSCGFTSSNKATVQYHERRHEMDALIDQISEVHDHKHFVQKEVIGFLDGWLEHGKMAGTEPCQHCGADVRVLFDQCPKCHRPAHELSDGAVLRCGECDSDEIRVMLKDGCRRKQGYRCTECGAFVAHGNGVFSFWWNADDGRQLGYWEEDESES